MCVRAGRAPYLPEKILQTRPRSYRHFFLAGHRALGICSGARITYCGPDRDLESTASLLGSSARKTRRGDLKSSVEGGIKSMDLLDGFGGVSQEGRAPYLPENIVIRTGI